jgi:PAS domain S-box-containing protein
MLRYNARLTQPVRGAMMTDRPAEIDSARAGIAEANLVDAIEQATVGYYELDRDFRYRRVNEAGARLLHLDRSDVLGRAVFELFPGIERSEVHAAVRRVMAGGSPESVEIYFPPFNMWGINDIIPLSDGVAIFSRDVTARKRLEQNLSFLAKASKALAGSLDYHRTLRTVAKLAVSHIADWCSVEMLMPEGGVELLAVAHIDPKRVRWAIKLRQDNPVDMDAPTGLPNVLRTGRSEFYPQITEEMIVAAAKDEKMLQLIRDVGISSVMIVPLLNHGRAIGAITFVSAESGRHFVAADLSMAEELASRAALAIENSRLYAESQKAVALRDDFIYVASHELRTPVTSLKLYTEVLQRQAERGNLDQIGKNLSKMNAQIDKLSVLIGDLLDVSRIEAGKLDLRDDEVDLSALVAEIVDAIQPTAPRHRIEVEGGITRTVRGDRDRLGQVLTNLLTNATKYSPLADRVIIRLGEDGDRAFVEFQDFGIGIDSEHLERIFERFYRVNGSDDASFPGLGIGLYITSQIVRRHGGTISVSSRAGEGSVFHVELPFNSPGN